MTSVLDLPVEEQQAIAKEEGIPFELWLAETRQTLQHSRQFVAEITTRETDMTSEQIAHMQRKMDDPLIPQ
jgi:antitoxin component of RelBE/YafQ-DinJ toxin-antitoxin module